jgi:hypothetical protein
MSQRIPLVILLAASSIGCPGGDVQVVEVTTPPTAEILSPGDNASGFAAGSLITFEGVVQDQQDSPDRLTASWHSDIDGLLDEAVPDSTGRVRYSTLDLSTGTHVVTLQVVDTDGEIGEDVVALGVERENTDPEVEITYPDNGSEFEQGETITFTAQAEDADDEDPVEELSIEWASDVDGFLGDDEADASGLLSLATANLSLGAHIISLSVTDSMGSSDTDQVYLEILEPNEPPQVSITEPLSGDIVLRSSVDFAGVVGDDVDRPDYLGITWESDIDGVFNWDPAGSAGMLGFTSSSLTLGAHTISLTAEDSGGLSARDSVSITVVGADDWDADGDGWTPNEGDCDDADASTSPGATESCDDIDNDCDGEINEDLGDVYEPNDGTPTDLGHMEGDSFCIYGWGYISGSSDTQTIAANIHSPDDVDHYVFTTNDDIADCLDESGYGIQISLTNVPAGHDYALDLYWNGGGGALVSSSDMSYNANEYVNFEGSYSLNLDSDDGGEFEIVVTPDSSSGYGCTDSYTLTVEVW